MSLQTFIDLNIKTVAFIKAQDFSGAIESSSGALKCCSTIPEARNSSCAIASDCLDQCMLRSEIIASDEAEDSFIYSQGIDLPSQITDPSIIIPIAIFNTALSHQLMATKRGNNNSLLHKAKKLYQHAFKSYDMSRNVLFEFAILNNVGIIDRSIGETERANEYFDSLMSIFILLVDQGNDSLLKHIQGFPLNLPSQNQTASAA